MQFGVHVSGAGGLEHIPEKAKRLGCETFQFFSRSPRGGRSVLTEETARVFRKSAKEFGFTHSYIHAPYFVNLASLDPRIYAGSIEVLRDELRRADMLGVRGAITHIGSAKGLERAEALRRVTDAVTRILAGTPSTLFLESSAGAGEVIGATLEELRDIREGVLRTDPLSAPRLRVMLDTAHLFASGHDIRTASGLGAVLEAYNTYFGLKNLEVFHVNDSKVGLGAKKDRHEAIGKGMLGLEAFRAFVNEPRLAGLNAILETPKKSDEDDLLNLALLRNLLEPISKMVSWLL